MGNTLLTRDIPATHCHDCKKPAPYNAMLNCKGAWFCSECTEKMREYSNKCMDQLRSQINREK